MERWIVTYVRRSVQRIATRHPTDNAQAARVIYNSHLTEISASGSDYLSTLQADSLYDSLDDEEGMRLFWSAQHVEGREDYELSVARRATV